MRNISLSAILTAMLMSGLPLLDGFPLAQAAMSKTVMVEGEVTGFDETWVTLSTQTGPVIVPRDQIPAAGDVRPGLHVEVQMELNDLVRVNGERILKAK